MQQEGVAQFRCGDVAQQQQLAGWPHRSDHMALGAGGRAGQPGGRLVDLRHASREAIILQLEMRPAERVRLNHVGARIDVSLGNRLHDRGPFDTPQFRAVAGHETAPLQERPPGAVGNEHAARRDLIRNPCHSTTPIAWHRPPLASACSSNTHNSPGATIAHAHSLVHCPPPFFKDSHAGRALSTVIHERSGGLDAERPAMGLGKLDAIGGKISPVRFRNDKIP